MNINSKNLSDIFTALDRQIGILGGSPISLVVCGGSALAALGLISRTTRDVDVLAGLDDSKGEVNLYELREFPVWLSKAAEVVARDFGLPGEWLNLGPASQMKSGLPEGLGERLVKQRYGKWLAVYFIERIDQVFFKLYASVDRGDYHVQDLLGLNPTGQEIEAAAEWCLTQDVSEGFRELLMDFLMRHGFGDVAEKI